MMRVGRKIHDTTSEPYIADKLMVPSESLALIELCKFAVPCEFQHVSLKHQILSFKSFIY
jgi:hypothetical protein